MQVNVLITVRNEPIKNIKKKKEKNKRKTIKTQTNLQIILSEKLLKTKQGK